MAGFEGTSHSIFIKSVLQPGSQSAPICFCFRYLNNRLKINYLTKMFQRGLTLFYNHRWSRV